jgi:FkbH-like protein
MHAQIERESMRKALPLAEFLETLELRVTFLGVAGTGDLQMNRALELFNKTNQFNTTGERYTLAACHRRFAAGHRLFAANAEDRFTQYGLIGAAWVVDNVVDHVVMSCRALGLGIEDAFLAHLTNAAMSDADGARFGRLQHTEANLPCRKLYSRLGFAQLANEPSLWSRAAAPPLMPPVHITVIAA